MHPTPPPRPLAPPLAVQVILKGTISADSDTYVKPVTANVPALARVMGTIRQKTNAFGESGWE